MTRRRTGEFHDWLVTRLPPELLADFLAQFGGCVLRAPRNVRETRAQRTARILAVVNSNSYKKTAELVGCSPATVFRVANPPNVSRGTIVTT